VGLYFHNEVDGYGGTREADWGFVAEGCCARGCNSRQAVDAHRGQPLLLLGEKGARETAKAIASQWETYKVLRSELVLLLNADFPSLLHG
jgi:hypothetical protein